MHIELAAGSQLARRLGPEFRTRKSGGLGPNAMRAGVALGEDGSEKGVQSLFRSLFNSVDSTDAQTIVDEAH